MKYILPKHKKDLTGEKVGMLLFVEYRGKTKNHMHQWLCRCDCGVEKVRLEADVLRRHTVSCGCYRVKQVRDATKTHGFARTRFYKIYFGIYHRCMNKNSKSYGHYGGRGIKCEWETFEQFRDDMHDSYLRHVEKYGEQNTTIERIDNDGNYCKGNCRWATRNEQSDNTRRSIRYKFKGKDRTLTEIARMCDMERKTLYYRLKRAGWSLERATTEPVKLK